MELTYGTKNEKAKHQISSPELQISIRYITEKEKYIKYEVAIQPFETQGNNFFGELYEIEIIGETAEGIKKETNIFLKRSVVVNNIKAVSVTDYFLKELFFYTDLSKILTSLQEQANVPRNDRYKVAEAYEGINNNAIILENLSRRGFTIYAKKEKISFKFAQLAVRQLAKFHALAFVIEHRMPEYYNNKIKVLKGPFRFDEDWEGLIRNICVHVANLYDDDVKKKIENFVPIFIKKFPKYFEDQKTLRCTLTHTDYKINNLLVRFEDGEPVEMIPVDYQFINHGCPIRDLIFFTFSGTDREFRRKHMKNLKELYFRTLSMFLKYFDMDVEAVYPREEFEKVYTEWLDYGLMMTLFATVVTCAPDTGVDFENLTFSEIPYCPDKCFDSVLRGLVDDFIEWGYL